MGTSASAVRVTVTLSRFMAHAKLEVLKVQGPPRQLTRQGFSHLEASQRSRVRNQGETLVLQVMT